MKQLQFITTIPCLECGGKISISVAGRFYNINPNFSIDMVTNLHNGNLILIREVADREHIQEEAQKERTKQQTNKPTQKERQ